MRRRLSWGNCGERFLEDHPEFEGRLTRRHGLSWHLVMALVRSWSDLVAEHRRMGTVRSKPAECTLACPFP